MAQIQIQKIRSLSVLDATVYGLVELMKKNR